jgi:4-carboxymuconolactone decarboxylase
MNPFKEHEDLINKFSGGKCASLESTLRPVFPVLVDHLVKDVYGFAYSRDEIDIKTRHLVTLGIIAAMGGCENQLEFQLRAALNIGLTQTEINEVFVQVCVFAGNARAINAALIFHRINNLVAQQPNLSSKEAS